MLPSVAPVRRGTVASGVKVPAEIRGGCGYEDVTRVEDLDPKCQVGTQHWQWQERKLHRPAAID